MTPYDDTDTGVQSSEVTDTFIVTLRTLVRSAVNELMLTPLVAGPRMRVPTNLDVAASKEPQTQNP